MSDSVSSRLGIAGTIYHQQEGRNPTSFSLKSKQVSLKDEQPYLRSFTPRLIPDWVKVSLGWVQNPAVICIRNEIIPNNPQNILLFKLSSEDTYMQSSVTALSVPSGSVSVIYPQNSIGEIPLFVKANTPDNPIQFTIFSVEK